MLSFKVRLFIQSWKQGVSLFTLLRHKQNQSMKIFLHKLEFLHQNYAVHLSGCVNFVLASSSLHTSSSHLGYHSLWNVLRSSLRQLLHALCLFPFILIISFILKIFHAITHCVWKQGEFITVFYHKRNHHRKGSSSGIFPKEHFVPLGFLWKTCLIFFLCLKQ